MRRSALPARIPVPSPLAALAAHRPLRRDDYVARDPRKPRRYFVQIEGWAVAALVPAPLIVRELYFLPYVAATRDVFRRGKELVIRPAGSTASPTPIDDDALVDELLALLRSLPEMPGASDSYRGLRRFVAHADTARLRDYARETVRSLRRKLDGVPTWRPPKPKATSAPSVPESEQRAARRAREVTAERAGVEWYLRSLLEDDDEPLVPGDRRPAEALFESAVDALADLADAEEPIDDRDPDGLRFRAPRRRVFYAVAREFFTERRDVHGARFYVIPETPIPQEEPVTDPALEAVIERAAEIVAERAIDYQARFRAGDRPGALLAQRDRLESTGTDGVLLHFPTAPGARR